MKISDGKYVAVVYDLTTGEGEAMEVMERATDETPLEFIFGTNSMLASFENKLDGLGIGDTFDFSLSPEDAYGEYEQEKVVELPKDIFKNEEGVVEEAVLFQGNSLPMMDSTGNQLLGTVVEVRGDIVVMDFNHPMAGQVMHFVGRVKEVREATPEDVAAFFGDAGCGCGGGCGSSCGSSCGDDSCETGCGGGCGCGCGC